MPNFRAPKTSKFATETLATQARLSSVAFLRPYSRSTSSLRLKNQANVIDWVQWSFCNATHTLYHWLLIKSKVKTIDMPQSFLVIDLWSKVESSWSRFTSSMPKCAWSNYVLYSFHPFLEEVVKVHKNQASISRHTSRAYPKETEIRIARGARKKKKTKKLQILKS